MRRTLLAIEPVLNDECRRHEADCRWVKEDRQCDDNDRRCRTDNCRCDFDNCFRPGFNRRRLEENDRQDAANCLYVILNRLCLIDGLQ